MSELYPIEQLVPHDRPLLLLDRLISADEGSITIEVVVRSDGLFDTAGQVPAILGIEYMAQGVSAYSGYQAKQVGRAIRLGFLLGTRRFETNVAHFNCGTVLTVHIDCVMQDKDGLASFDCTVMGETAMGENVEQSARISVFEPEDSQSYLEGRRKSIDNVR